MLHEFTLIFRSPRPQNVDVCFPCFEEDVMNCGSVRKLWRQQKEMRFLWKWEGSSLSSHSLGSPEDGVGPPEDQDDIGPFLGCVKGCGTFTGQLKFACLFHCTDRRVTLTAFVVALVPAESILHHEMWFKAVQQTVNASAVGPGGRRSRPLKSFVRHMH